MRRHQSIPHHDRLRLCRDADVPPWLRKSRRLLLGPTVQSTIAYEDPSDPNAPPSPDDLLDQTSSKLPSPHLDPVVLDMGDPPMRQSRESTSEGDNNSMPENYLDGNGRPNGVQELDHGASGKEMKPRTGACTESNILKYRSLFSQRDGEANDKICKTDVFQLFSCFAHSGSWSCGDQRIMRAKRASEGVENDLQKCPHKCVKKWPVSASCSAWIPDLRLLQSGSVSYIPPSNQHLHSNFLIISTSHDSTNSPTGAPSLSHVITATRAEQIECCLDSMSGEINLGGLHSFPDLGYVTQQSAEDSANLASQQLTSTLNTCCLQKIQQT